MNIRWRARGMPMSVLFISLGLFLLVACGPTASNKGGSAAAHTSATAAAKCTPTAGTTQTAVGTLKSIHGQTLVLTDQQKKELTITYSSATHFTRQAHLPASALQEGTEVNVVVTGSNGVYAATSITVVPGGSATLVGTPGPSSNGTPGTIFQGTPPPGAGTPGTIFQGTPPPGAPSSSGSNSSNNPCVKQVEGTPGSSGTGPTNPHGIFGKVGQVNGDILTVIDPTGASYTVTLTPQTQIIGTQNATAAALKVGEPLIATGTKKQGVIVAKMVQILLILPTSPITNS